MTDDWKNRKENAKKVPKEKRIEFMTALKQGKTIGECCNLINVDLYVGMEIINDNIVNVQMLSSEIV